MQNRMIRKIVTLGILISAIPMVYAATYSPVLTITPSITTTNIRPDVTSLITTFTVKNTSGVTLSNFTFYPAFQNKNRADLPGISLQNNNCANATLINNGTCSFQVLANGTSAPQSGSYQLMPKVCANNNTVCSKPTNSNYTTVNVLTLASGAVVRAYLSMETPSDTLQPIVASSNALSTAISGYTFNFLTQGVAVSLNGSTVYTASGLSTPPAVIVFDAASNTNVATIDNAHFSNVAADFSPIGIAVSPDGTRLYLVDYVNNKLYVFNTSTPSSPIYITTVSFSAPFVNAPHGVAVSPDGTKVFVSSVSNSTSNYGAMIDVSNNYAVTYFPTADSAPDLIVSPDGSTLYVAGTFPGALPGAPSTNYIQIFNIATLSASSSPTNIALPSNTNSRGLAITSDGNTLYVANPTLNTVSKISNLTTTKDITNITVGTSPYGVAVTPDGSKVFVSLSAEANVSVISTADNSVTTVPVASTQRTQGKFVG